MSEFNVGQTLYYVRVLRKNCEFLSVSNTNINLNFVF